MAKFVLKSPIKFVQGTGFTITPNDTNINLTSPVQVVFNIGQEIEKNSNVTFSTISSSQEVVDNNLSIINNQIDNLSTISANTSVRDDFSTTENLTVKGGLIAEKFESEFTESITIFDSGSTKFGDDVNDKHRVTGSLSTSGSLLLNNYMQQVVYHFYQLYYCPLLVIPNKSKYLPKKNHLMPVPPQKFHHFLNHI